jgi:hypothetical protein
MQGYALAQWLRHYARTWKVAGLRPGEMNEYFSIYLILPVALGPEVDSASNGNDYQKQKNNVSREQSAASAQGLQPCHHLWANCLDNVGSSTSHTPIGLHSLLRE